MPSKPARMALGCWFEDFVLGEERLAPRRTVARDNRMTFAELAVGDSQLQPAEASRKTGFCTRITRSVRLSAPPESVAPTPLFAAIRQSVVAFRGPDASLRAYVT